MDAAAEADATTKADVDTKGGAVVAEGGTKIKGARTKVTCRGTITTTTTTNSKDTIMTITTTMGKGEASNKVHLQDNIKAKGVTNLLPRGEAKPWMGTTSITHDRPLREMSGQVQQDTLEQGGTMLEHPVAGETPSLRAPLKEPWTL